MSIRPLASLLFDSGLISCLVALQLSQKLHCDVDQSVHLYSGIRYEEVASSLVNAGSDSLEINLLCFAAPFRLILLAVY